MKRINLSVSTGTLSVFGYLIKSGEPARRAKLVFLAGSILSTARPINLAGSNEY
jgi:hypothetical protein